MLLIRKRQTDKEHQSI